MPRRKRPDTAPLSCMTILPPGRIFFARHALCTQATYAKKSCQKSLCLAVFSQYAKQATSVRWAEAHPAQTQRLSRLTAFQRSRGGRRRPGGLKRCCSQQSAWVFFLRWVLFWQKETRVLRVSWFALCCVFLSADGRIHYCNWNLS